MALGMSMEKIMSKGMTYVMLNCDKATYLLSKRETEKLKCAERIKLRMHLVSCKYCRMFAQQTRYITKQIRTFAEIDPNNLSLALTEAQKHNLQEAVDEQLNTK